MSVVVVGDVGHAPCGMVVTGLGPALGTRLGVRPIEDCSEIEVVTALESARFLESSMSTLLHGPAPT